jgi:hypothetical protein
MEGGVTSSLATYYPTTTAAYYAARFDYNPSTLAALGLLIEEQRTNSIRNNTMQGAVAGTPGTLPTNWTLAATSLTQQVVGTGTENGITYIDIKLSGTTGSTRALIRPEPTTQIAAANGQVWTNSSYVRLAAGSLSNITSVELVVRENDAGGAELAASTTTIVPTSAALSSQRGVVTRTLNNASTAFVMPVIYLNYSSGVAIDITLRIGLPQLEQGAFATSVIPTSTTALTRNADVASMTGTNFSSWYNATEGTLYYEGMVQINNDGIVYTGIGNTFDNTAYFVRTAPNQTWAVRSGASAQAAVDVVFTPTANVPFKMVGTLKVNDFAFCVNGGAVATDVSGAVPASAVRLGIGNAPWTASGGNARQQWIRSIRYYPVRLANSTLQALTA